MKITETIHQLRIDFEINLSPQIKLPRFVNVLIIFGRSIVIVDTGVKGSEGRIFDYIRLNGRDISEIGEVILSHSHPDHIGSASAIRDATGCRIAAHPAEKEWIENIEIQNSERAVPGFFSLVDTSVTVNDYLHDGLVRDLGGSVPVRFTHSPGHSKGSMNILFTEDGILFTADSIPLKNDIPNYDNFRDLMRSLAYIKSRKDYGILLTSWTPPVSSGPEIQNLISDGEDYLNRIDKAVRECYANQQNNDTDSCRSVIEKLGMPPFFVNPVVNRAFLSHNL